jgi:hypothetical protein
MTEEVKGLFTREIDDFLTDYLGETLSTRALRATSDYISLRFKISFTEEEIKERLEYLTEEAGGSDKPIVEEPAEEVTSKPKNKKQKVKKVKEVKNNYQVIVNEKTLWEGTKKPSVDLTKSEKIRKFYILIEGKICWEGTKKPAVWVCKKY